MLPTACGWVLVSFLALGSTFDALHAADCGWAQHLDSFVFEIIVTPQTQPRVLSSQPKLHPCMTASLITSFRCKVGP